jgi:hypothetical protein
MSNHTTVDFGETTRPRLRCAGFAFALLASLAGANSVFAQMSAITEQSDSTRGAECRSWAAALSGVSADAAPDSIETALVRCELSGPAVFAAQWNTVSSSGRGLSNLVTAGRYLRDERLFVAVKNAATDGGRASEVRIAALNVLAAYAKPSLARIPLYETTDGNGLLYGSGVDTISSDQPISGNVADRVHNGFELVAYEGATNRIPRTPGRVAMRRPGRGRHEDVPLPTYPSSYARDLMMAFDADNAVASFPIASPNITLSYICGNKFSVKNYTPFDLAFSYDVSNSGNMYEVRVSGTMPGTDVAERVFSAPTAGSVRLFYLDAVIATASHGGTTCP